MGRVSSRTIGGMGKPGSLPKTAAELANTKRGRLPAALRASSRVREVSRFDRRPRSKSASHSAETAAARWKTTSYCWLAKTLHWSIKVPTSTCTRGSLAKPVAGCTWSAKTSWLGEQCINYGHFKMAWANRVPRNPAPPVIRIFMVLPSLFLQEFAGRARCSSPLPTVPARTPAIFQDAGNAEVATSHRLKANDHRTSRSTAILNREFHTLGKRLWAFLHDQTELLRTRGRDYHGPDMLAVIQ